MRVGETMVKKTVGVVLALTGIVTATFLGLVVSWCGLWGLTWFLLAAISSPTTPWWGTALCWLLLASGPLLGFGLGVRWARDLFRN